MKNFLPGTYLLIAVLFAIEPAAMSAQSDAFLRKKGEGEVWIYGGGGSTKTIYDARGTQRLFDTAGTRFGAYVLGADFNYGVSDRIELNASLPIGRYTLRSDHNFPDRTIVAPAFLGIGGTVAITEGDFRSAFALQLRVPPGFHNGIYDDPNHPSFLSDGWLEIRPTLAAAYAGSGYWLKGGVTYGWRAEEPEDEIVLTAEAGLNRVEGTGIFLSAEWVMSLGDPSNPARPFYAGSDGAAGEFTGGTGRLVSIAEEEYFVVAPGAYFEFLEQWTLSTQYRLRLVGTHTIRLNALYLAVGHQF